MAVKFVCGSSSLYQSWLECVLNIVFMVGLGRRHLHVASPASDPLAHCPHSVRPPSPWQGAATLRQESGACFCVPTLANLRIGVAPLCRLDGFPTMCVQNIHYRILAMCLVMARSHVIRHKCYVAPIAVTIFLIFCPLFLLPPLPAGRGGRICWKEYVALKP